MIRWFRRGKAKEINARAETFKIFIWCFLALMCWFVYLYAEKAFALYPIPPENQELWRVWISDIKSYSFGDYLWEHWYYFVLGVSAVALLADACFRFFRQNILTIQMTSPFFVLFLFFLLTHTSGPLSSLLFGVYDLDVTDFAAFWLLLLFVIWRNYIRYPDFKKERLRQSPAINARAESFMIFIWLLLGLLHFFIYLYVIQSIKYSPPESKELLEMWAGRTKHYSFADYLWEHWYYCLLGVSAAALLADVCFRYFKPHNLFGFNLIFPLPLLFLASELFEGLELIEIFNRHYPFSISVYIIDYFLFYFSMGWVLFMKLNFEKYGAFALNITVEQMDKFEEMWKPKLDSDKKKLIADELGVSIEKIDELDEIWTKKERQKRNLGKVRGIDWERIVCWAIILPFLFFLIYMGLITE